MKSYRNIKIDVIQLISEDRFKLCEHFSIIERFRIFNFIVKGI